MSRLLASLSAPSGPHPTTGELRDYAAGTLPPAAQHRVEAHALACPRCADALTGWQLSAPAPADAALARLRGRLRERVQALEPLAGEVPLPTTVPAAPTGGAAPWLGLRRWAAAAAVAGLTVVGVWAWQHHEAAEITRPEVAAVAPAPPASGEAANSPTSTENAAAAPTAPLAPPAASDAVAAAKPSSRPAQGPSSAAGRPVRPQPTAPVVAQTQADAAASAPAEAEGPTGSIAAEASTTEAATAPPTVAYTSTETSDKKQEARSKALKAAPAANQEDDKADRAATVADAAPASAKTARPIPTATAMPAPAPIGPAPVGGWLALRERLRRQAADFDPAENATRLTGTVHLRLLIGPDGKVQESKILRGLRADYDAEALRLTTEAAPRWQPGLANGRRAALPVELTVSF